MQQSVLDRLVIMLFILVNVAWDKGMNEARLWYIGFWNMGRIRDVSFGIDRWTCKRTADNVLVQLDYIIGMPAFVMMSTWNDYELPIGLDHRCVHRILTLLHTRRSTWKTWFETLDAEFILSWGTLNFSKQTSCLFQWFSIHVFIICGWATQSW